MGIEKIIEIISNVIVGLVALFGSVYGVKQVREARKSRLLGPYFEIDRRLHEQREDRKRLYEWADNINDEWRRTYERIAVTLDVLGALVREDMVYRPIVFKIYYDVIIKTWDTVKSYIYSERNTKSKSNTYMTDFEYLFQESKKYAEHMGLDYPQVRHSSFHENQSKVISQDHKPK